MVSLQQFCLKIQLDSDNFPGPLSLIHMEHPYFITFVIYFSALPADLTPSSGLRFGTRRETYLEFNKKLRIKRRANFGVEFKTNERNGIIFYIGDDKNNDFITLFVKNGLVSKTI